MCRGPDMLNRGWDIVTLYIISNRYITIGIQPKNII